jgi:peptidyl-prolyl cis-trans isomerase SurA
MNEARRWLCALGAGLTLLACSPVSADIVERVVATVNDEAIFLSDLRQRATPFLPRLAESPTETERLARLKQIYADILGVLIDEELLKQLAQELNIVVSSQDVEQFIENIRQQNNLSPEQFWAAVEAEGMSEAQYRKDLRRQILRFKVTNERVRSRVNITEEEVRRRYQQRAREKGSEIRFHVADIVVPVEDESSATNVAAARDEAQQIRDALTQDNFAERASELGGGDLGWLSQEDLASEMETVLLRTEDGEITQPVRVGSGFHILYVQERRVGQDFPSYEEMKEELMREMLDAAMLRQEQIFLEELRRKAVINRML